MSMAETTHPDKTHPGLPVVPHPAAGELLGSWLLKVAKVYGLGLGELLVRLGATAPTSSAPRWYELHRAQLDLVQLAAALRRSTESIAALAAPQCSRRWPAELGFCGHCLDESASAGGACGWQRRWMHPMALACSKHRRWLHPAAIRRLAAVEYTDDFARFPRKSPLWSTWELQRESALIDSALWLEALVVSPHEHQPPWGKTEPQQLAKILHRLVEVLMAPGAADMVRHQLGRSPRDMPERRQRWAVQTVRIDDGASAVLTLPAPHHLRHRQFVFGLLGHYLRQPPTNRGALAPLAKSIIQAIPEWQLARWPDAAARWIAPRSPSYAPPRARRRTSGRSTGPLAPAPLFGI